MRRSITSSGIVACPFGVVYLALNNRGKMDNNDYEDMAELAGKIACLYHELDRLGVPQEIIASLLQMYTSLMIEIDAYKG